MVSPRLIIDEFLLSEKVVDLKKPCYFLFDMGHWQIDTSIISPVSVNGLSSQSMLVEVEPGPDHYTIENNPAC